MNPIHSIRDSIEFFFFFSFCLNWALNFPWQWIKILSILELFNKIWICLSPSSHNLRLFRIFYIFFPDQELNFTGELNIFHLGVCVGLFKAQSYFFSIFPIKFTHRTPTKFFSKSKLSSKMWVMFVHIFRNTENS